MHLLYDKLTSMCISRFVPTDRFAEDAFPHCVDTCLYPRNVKEPPFWIGSFFPFFSRHNVKVRLLASLSSLSSSPLPSTAGVVLIVVVCRWCRLDRRRHRYCCHCLVICSWKKQNWPYPILSIEGRLNFFTRTYLSSKCLNSSTF